MRTDNQARLNMNNFIATERQICDSAFPAIVWDSNKWPILALDPSFRGKPFNLPFTVYSLPIVNRSVKQPEKDTPLPSPYREFCKALVIHIKRSFGVNGRALYAYLNESRRLYNVMYFRNESSPTLLKQFHFHYMHEYLAETGYVQLYDATTTLSKISNIIDKEGISTTSTSYKTSEKPKRQHYRIKHEDEEPEGKEFSREAVEAYAVATNNPLNDGEEILLRTDDLLFSMGQRANEVTHIPLDCWVERIEKNNHGVVITLPQTDEPLKSYGIRYYAEKKAKSRVHWLAEQDVPFAKRAVERLKVLTKAARQVAEFQYHNPGRMWNLPREREMTYAEIFKYFSFASRDGLQKFLKRIGVTSCGGAANSPLYRAGDIEDAMLGDKRFGPSIRNTIALADTSGEPVLLKHQLLSLAFEGAFRMKRQENELRVIVHKLSVEELNYSLGANVKRESIFDRRNLTEADGTRIVLTTHMPRHWRNTLYEIAGMSEAQQALALGRADISQNKHYQHATIEDKNASLHEFINTRNPDRRVELFKQGVRDGLINGNIAEAYETLRRNSPIEAEEFLNIHVMAVHVTPYGACAHDFSKAPCPKHLQCFNSCAHLHRTNNPTEIIILDELIKRQEENIDRMKTCGCGDAGTDEWINAEERKLTGMKAARSVDTSIAPVKVFPLEKKLRNKLRQSAVRKDYK